MITTMNLIILVSALLGVIALAFTFMLYRKIVSVKAQLVALEKEQVNFSTLTAQKIQKLAHQQKSSDEQQSTVQMIALLTKQHEQIEQECQRMDSRITTVQQQVNELLEQQPEDKLYSRALKLAALGADANELVAECKMSMAEAEMLLAIHQRKS